MTKAMIKETEKKIVLPDFIKNIEADGRGNEDVGVDDMVIPRLELVQSSSPCRKKNDAAYIEGAEEGFLYNNVTRELYGESVEILFVSFRTVYILWGDRKKGGGFHGAFDSMQEAQEKLNTIEEEGVEIQKTHQHYGIVQDKLSGRSHHVVLSMPRTKEKVSRRLNSILSMLGGDRFNHLVTLFSVLEKNKNGESYYNYDFKINGFVQDKQFYIEAEKAYEKVTQEDVQASYDYDTVSTGDLKQEF